jgi:hypothetical protein
MTIDELDKTGRVSVTVGATLITIENVEGCYEILVKEADLTPFQWLYRDKTIAIDRFEEQVSHYRRVK